MSNVVRHRLVHTEAFILGHRDYGEANRLLYLLTPNLGLVLAAAQSLRSLASKLRPHLQTYAVARVSLVRGREVWRVTGAERQAWLISLYQTTAGFNLVARIFTLLRRLLPGEEPNPELFADLKTSLASLVASPPPADLWYRHELLLVLRLLRRLGYVADFTYQRWRQSAGDAAIETDLVRLINSALGASQL